MAEALPYTGVPNVSPQGPATPEESVNASPEAFGGGVAKAVQGAGQNITQAANTQFAEAMRKQGMINETLATNAETLYSSDLADVHGKFRTLEGLAAVGAKDGTVASVQALRQRYAATLPNDMARRAFTNLALRHEAATIGDINEYAATQVKAADTLSAKASSEQAISRAADYTVASNEARFDDTLKDVDFNTVRTIANQGYGVGMHQNPDTGVVTFDDSPQGKQAEAVYNFARDEDHGKAWTARIHSLANDTTYGSVPNALAVLNANRPNIPPLIFQQLSAELNPRARAAAAEGTARDVISQAAADYRGQFGGTQPANTNVPPPPLTTLKTSSGQPVQVNSAYASNFDGFIKDLEATGYKINSIGGYSNRNVAGTDKPSFHADGASIDINPGQNPVGPNNTNNLPPNIAEIAARHGLGWGGNWTTKKDPMHFSIAREEGGTVDIPRGANAAPQPGSNGYQGWANYLRQHEAELTARTDAQSEATHPGDAEFADRARAHTQREIQLAISQQEASYTADIDALTAAAHTPDKDGKLPTTLEEVTSRSPALMTSYTNVLTNRPLSVSGLDRLFAANAGGKANTYGNQFWSLYQKVTAPAGDPNRISDAADLARYVTGNLLTNTGYTALKGIMDRGAKDPQANAFTAAERSFFNYAHGQISGQNDRTGQGDPVGEEKFNKFMMTAIPMIEAGRAQGLTAAQLFNEKNAAWIGHQISPFVRSPMARFSDMMKAGLPTNAGPADTGIVNPHSFDLKTPTGMQNFRNALLTAVRAGKMSRDDAIKMGQENGAIAGSQQADAGAPPVPVRQ